MGTNGLDKSRIESRDFDQVLYEIRNSPAQNKMITQEKFAFLKICLFICAFCFLIFASIEAWQLDLSVWYSIAGVTFAIWCLNSSNSVFVSNNVNAKTQDRIYFLKCIHAARSVDELNQAGFFRLMPSRLEDGFEGDWEEEIARMIKALSRRSESKVELFPNQGRPYDAMEEKHYEAERGRLV